jgi:hypothetical protein
VIYLATPTFDDAFRLFTIVNDRGKQLRRIDVLKAINIDPSVISQETVRNRVAQQWEDLEKDLGGQVFEDVVHLVRMAVLKDKPQGDLLKEFEDRVFSPGIVAKGEPFLNFVFDYVKHYKSIFVDRDILPEDDVNHNKYCALIHIMDAEFRASEWRACLLLYAAKFGADRFYDFCLQMEKVYLAHWVKGVRKDERYGDYSKILGGIESAKDSDRACKMVTYDMKVIKEAVKTQNLYGAGFCRYFLLRLELLAAEHDGLREFAAHSVEHVLPLKPEPTGYWADHHDLDSIGAYVNTIGNLVLLSKSKNSAASNYAFETKKQRYLKSRVSDYPRSVQILAYNDWDKSVIEARTKEACDLIVRDP